MLVTLQRFRIKVKQPITFQQFKPNYGDQWLLKKLPLSFILYFSTKVIFCSKG